MHGVKTGSPDPAKEVHDTIGARPMLGGTNFEEREVSPQSDMAKLIRCHAEGCYALESMSLC